MTTTERTMTAGITAQGTAAAETALCSACETPVTVAYFTADDVVRRGDASGNEALECQNCGWYVA